MKQELFVKLILDSWNSNLSRVTDLVHTLTDEQLQKEVAPGRNTGIYLLGHLTAVNDRLLAMFNFEPQLYPQLDEVFLTSPDKAGKEMPSAADLRSYWKKVNETLSGHFTNLQPDDWFKKHNSVSDEDFAKEPHRNRLNVLISRNNHLSYHFGQMIFLKK
jgi:hypothetical protein